jgi:hypothetical protein
MCYAKVKNYLIVWMSIITRIPSPRFRYLLLTHSLIYAGYTYIVLIFGGNYFISG